MGELIGGVVTRAGPVTDTDVAPADQEALARLNLRPVFVGISSGCPPWPPEPTSDPTEDRRSYTTPGDATLARIAEHPANRLDELLPWEWKKAAPARSAA